jgi:hypothetical protein
MAESDSNSPDPASADYEAPCIETVLTPEELEREVIYGGGGSVPVCV